jgi:hypothetical protein
MNGLVHLLCTDTKVTVSEVEFVGWLLFDEYDKLMSYEWRASFNTLVPLLVCISKKFELSIFRWVWDSTHKDAIALPNAGDRLVNAAIKAQDTVVTQFLLENIGMDKGRAMTTALTTLNRNLCLVFLLEMPLGQGLPLVNSEVLGRGVNALHQVVALGAAGKDLLDDLLVYAIANDFHRTTELDKDTPYSLAILESNAVALHAMVNHSLFEWRSEFMNIVYKRLSGLAISAQSMLMFLLEKRMPLNLDSPDFKKLESSILSSSKQQLIHALFSSPGYVMTITPQAIVCMYSSLYETPSGHLLNGLIVSGRYRFGGNVLEQWDALYDRATLSLKPQLKILAVIHELGKIDVGERVAWLKALLWKMRIIHDDLKRNGKSLEVIPEVFRAMIDLPPEICEIIVEDCLPPDVDRSPLKKRAVINELISPWCNLLDSLK